MPSKEVDLLPLWSIEKALEEIGSELLDCHLYMRGESLLAGYDYFSQLVEIVRRNANPKCVVTLVTNGMLLNDDFIRLFQENNVNLVFSIDSSTKESFESIRRGSSFEIVQNNLKKALEASIFTSFYTSVQGVNLAELQDISALAEKLGVPEINMGLVLMPKHCSVQWNVENLLQLLKQSSAVVGYSCKVSFPKHIPGFSWKNGRYVKEALSEVSKTCSICMSSLTISATGNIFACFKQPQILGNIISEGKLPSIESRMIASSMVNGHAPPESCFPCTWTGRGLELIPNWKHLEAIVLSGEIDSKITNILQCP